MSTLTLPKPLFFKVIKANEPQTTVFVNAAHVVKIEIDAAQLKSGVLYVNDGTQIEFGASEADWIMRLMSAHAHEQMKVVSELKRLSGDK